jgi:rhodanese-related sulfurtransferase
MSSSPGWITAEELGEKLQDPSNNNDDDNTGKRRKLVVIDVRDSDFKGGNIVGAVNIPSEQFRARVPEIISSYKDTETIVVHCMMSQVRGPTCAKILFNELQRELNGDGKVVILEGGYSSWTSTHKNKNPHLFENFIPDFNDD